MRPVFNIIFLHSVLIFQPINFVFCDVPTGAWRRQRVEVQNDYSGTRVKYLIIAQSDQWIFVNEHYLNGKLQGVGITEASVERINSNEYRAHGRLFTYKIETRTTPQGDVMFLTLDFIDDVGEKQFIFYKINQN